MQNVDTTFADSGWPDSESATCGQWCRHRPTGGCGLARPGWPGSRADRTELTVLTSAAARPTSATVTQARRQRLAAAVRLGIRLSLSVGRRRHGNGSRACSVRVNSETWLRLGRVTVTAGGLPPVRRRIRNSRSPSESGRVEHTTESPCRSDSPDHRDGVTVHTVDSGPPVGGPDPSRQRTQAGARASAESAVGRNGAVSSWPT